MTSRIPLLMQEALVPGLQIATIDRGRVRVRAYGVADVQSGGVVRENTVFEAASLGKPVLAYGVLELASEKRIDIDAPISGMLAGLDNGVEALTVRQLLSHTAGLPNSGPARRAASAGTAAPRFSYSGEGFRLLQRLVERVTGQPLQEFMQAAVFEPLGMTSSSFVWRDEYAERKAFGHGATGQSAGRNRIAQAQAASSLETTAADYARFLVAMVRGTGLRPDLAKALLQQQIRLEEGCVLCLARPRGPPAAGGWGLGIGLEPAGGRTFAWHWGDNQSMQSYAAIDTAGERGVVIMTNSANGHSIARRIASDVLGVEAPGYAWLASYGVYSDPDRRLLARIVTGGAAAIGPADLALAADDLRATAGRLLSGGRAAEAAKLIQGLIARGGAEAEDQVLLAEALRKSGRRDEARVAAAAALRLQPDDPDAKKVLERIKQAETIIPVDRLARFAGRYSSPYGPLEISSDGRRLTARLLDQPPSEMLPLSQSEFQIETMGVPIAFVSDASGAVSHAIVRAGGEIRLPRLP